MRRLSLVLLAIWALGVGTPALGQVSVSHETSASNDSDLWLALRGRLAIIAKQWLLYVTGGDIGETRPSAVDACMGMPCSSLALTGADQTFGSGWALGAGLEGVLSGPWTARVEYLRYDIGPGTAAGDTGSSKYGWMLDAEGQLVRAGLNYTFGGAN